MTALPTLAPEIVDLGFAIGLLTPSGGGVELDSDWFDDPGGRMAGVLADDVRRDALIRFADAVLAQGEHTEDDGVALLRLAASDHAAAIALSTCRHPGWSRSRVVRMWMSRAGGGPGSLSLMV
jgi:hypothetical protein